MKFQIIRHLVVYLKELKIVLTQYYFHGNFYYSTY